MANKFNRMVQEVGGRTPIWRDATYEGEQKSNDQESRQSSEEDGQNKKNNLQKQTRNLQLYCFYPFGLLGQTWSESEEGGKGCSKDNNKIK